MGETFPLKKKEKEKEKKGGVNSATVNPGQVAMTTCPTGNMMVSDPFF